MEFLNVPYSASPSRDSFREFDLYLPAGPLDVIQKYLPPLLCFIHGGAWRAEDKTDHKSLARKLALQTRCPVAVPNYRLTPRDPPGDDHFKHPGHTQDILLLLQFLISWEGPPGIGRIYNPQMFYLVGHSCSAHMLACIFLNSSPISPSLTPPPTLLQAVKGIVISEGIYDPQMLLTRFPKYREWFIAPTFGQLEDFSQFSVINYPLRSPNIRWLVIHSDGDTLVDRPQSEAMYSHLRALHGVNADTLVQSNMTELDGDHNDILRGDDYVEIVKAFVLRDGYQN